MRRDTADLNRLQRFHASVGRARQARSPQALAEIAIHFDQAGIKDQAFDAALKAAEAARADYAYEEAAELLAIAERNAAGQGELADVRFRLAQIAEATGKYDTGLQLCDQADEWCSKNAAADRRIAIRRMRERMNDLLGQPASKTFEACSALFKDAEREKCGTECVNLLLIMSQTRARMGDLDGAREFAEQAVKRSESLGDRALLAASLNRLGLTLRPTDPDRAVASWRRALDLYRDLGDDRGAAGCHNNLGIYHSDRGEWKTADRELKEATRLARRAGVRADLGAATLNLGVAVLKCGDFDQAHHHLGESLAQFAQIRNSERQLYALYNLAHLERERGNHEEALDLYDFTGHLAKRIGQSDVEIGALAGTGLCRLNLGQTDAAAQANKETQTSLSARRDWFQGRELAEALNIRLTAQKGGGEAVGLFDTALARAESSDFFCAAWLTAECAKDLLAHDGEHVRSSVSRLAPQAERFGLGEISRRYSQVLAHH